MKRHFVVFMSPGTFVAETSERPVDSWNVTQAKEMARGIVERYGATPYGFYFITRSRTSEELDSKITDRSGMYYLGGKIETLAEIEARNNRNERILRDNMKCNGWGRVVRTRSGWTQPLEADDVVLDWTN